MSQVRGGERVTKARQELICFTLFFVLLFILLHFFFWRIYCRLLCFSLLYCNRVFYYQLYITTTKIPFFKLSTYSLKFQLELYVTLLPTHHKQHLRAFLRVLFTDPLRQSKKLSPSHTGTQLLKTLYIWRHSQRNTCRTS